MFRDLFPQVPFLAILGTSHTAGDCVDGNNEKVKSSYGELLAGRLGLEYVNLGLPGASNAELLQIANELVALQLLDNCHTFLLEPRLGTGTLEISRDPVLDYYHNDLFHNNKIVHPTLVNTEHFAALMKSHQPTSSQNYISIMAGSKVDLELIKDKIAGGFPENIANVDDYEFKRFVNFIKDKIYYESQTSHRKLTDMTTIHSIKHIIMGAGISSFGWLNFNGAPAHHPMIQDIYRHYLPLKHCPEGSCSKRDVSIISYISENYPQSFIEMNQCECGHYNQQVHEIIAKILYESLQ